MKLFKRNISTKKQRKLKERLLRYFLIFSIICSVLLISNCDELFNHIPDFPGDGGKNPGNTSAGGSAISFLFKAAATGAGSGVSSAATGWALGALGLTNSSPDYTGQFDKINQSLQEIISQLNAVQDQLADINQQLLVLDCSAQQTALTAQTGRIDFLSTLYRSYIATATGGGRISNTTLSNWVDQVLAEGQYTSQTPMGQILTTIANQLIQPSSGAITACVKAIQAPGNDTFSDIPYYKNVELFTNYYYYYQAEGLFLLNEALHYKAWAAAASEDDDNYSADSVSNVCSNVDASLYCIKTAAFTNTVYNALTDQFTSGGAPYTDDYFVIQNSETTPRLWVKSLEEFTIAHGDNCNTPLNSLNNKCGVTVGRYNGGNSSIINEIYRGYTKWQFAASSELNTLLAGWNSGTAGSYLENTLGFKNMSSKIILSTNTTTISLSNSGTNQTAVIFFDSNGGKTKISGKLFDNKSAFDLITPNRKTVAQGSCSPFASNFYTFTGSNAGTNSTWYSAYGQAEWCGSNVLYGGVRWSTQPAWIASNTAGSSKQFRLPFSYVQNFNCTENRSKKNAGSVWTTCGDDFTYWFDNIVPRPETCDMQVGVICKLDYQSISKANKMFVSKNLN